MSFALENSLFLTLVLVRMISSFGEVKLGYVCYLFVELDHCSNWFLLFLSTAKRCFWWFFFFLLTYNTNKWSQKCENSSAEGMAVFSKDFRWKVKAYGFGTRACWSRTFWKSTLCVQSTMHVFAQMHRRKLCIMHHPTPGSTHPGIMSQGEITCTPWLPHTLIRER